MLDLGKDRLDYGRLLECPSGYVLDFALGTTYSLDLEALMSIHLSLGLSVTPDSSISDNPTLLFAALSEMQGKIAVFCEKGKVRCARQYQSLYSQIEDCIVEVDLPGPDFPSFHPKMWILRFVSSTVPSKIQYRVVLLSRNMTFDSSLDVAGILTSTSKGLNNKKCASGGGALGKTIQALTSYCPDNVKPSLRDKLQTIAKELPYASLRSDEESSWKYQSPLLFSGNWAHEGNSFQNAFATILQSTKRILMMTPFLSNTTESSNPVSAVSSAFQKGEIDRSSSFILVRRDALLGQQRNTSWLSTLPLYAIRTDLASASPPDSDGDAPERSRDIHAKIIVMEALGESECLRTHLFYGSANATKRGMAVNNEVMAHLISDRTDAYDRLIEELGLDEKTQQSGSIFEPLGQQEIERLTSQKDTSESESERAFSHYLRRVSIEMKADEQQDGVLDVSLFINDARTDPYLHRHLTYSLFSGSPEKPHDKHLVYSNISLEHLTEFVRVTYTSQQETRSGLVKCSIPFEIKKLLEKQRHILFEQLCANDEQSLLEYLNFRLSDNPELTARTSALPGKGNAIVGLSLLLEGLYENLIESYTARLEKTRTVVADCISLLSNVEGTPFSKNLLTLLETFEEGDRSCKAMIK